jgi:hypothetical protein
MFSVPAYSYLAMPYIDPPLLLFLKKMLFFTVAV